MSGFQVGPETFVTVRAQVLDEEGEALFEDETLAFVFGVSQLFPKVEQALEGHSDGDVVSVRLGPKDAFGFRDPKGVLEVDRSEFPEEVVPGDRFEVENDEGGILVLQVLDVQPEIVVVDTNHPLADQTITVRVTLLEVRPASEDELAGAFAEQSDPSSGGPEAVDMPLIGVDRLLRGRPRR